MATSTGKTHCIKCDKEKATVKCGGCLKDFCYKHLGDHRQELNKQFDDIEVNRDLFRQSLTQQIEQPNNHRLIEQINIWKEKSIKIIEQTAIEAREILIKHTTERIHQIEIKLNKLTNQLRESRNEDDFNEINLRHFQEELERLAEELAKPSNITIREESTSFISKISVHISTNDIHCISNKSASKICIQQNTKWIQNGITVAGRHEKGNQLDQLNRPCGMYLDENDQTMYVADYENNRIMKWKCGETNGLVVAGGNGRGTRMNQLNNPTDVILDKEKNNLIICDRGNRRVVQWPLQNGITGKIIISNIDCNVSRIDSDGYLYVSDREKDEVRRWKIGDANGILVAGGNGKGNALNQLNWPTFIFIDDDHSIYVSDYNNHRVMKWVKGAKAGIVVAGGQGQGKSLAQLSGCEGLLVDQLGAIYVADANNDRIMRWCKEASQGSIVVGGNGKGKQANQFDYPASLSFDQSGNLYVGDYFNYRIQRFNIVPN